MLGETLFNSGKNHGARNKRYQPRSFSLLLFHRNIFKLCLDGIFGATYFWNYIENLDKCLPGAGKK
jgi:hypothetical protein